MLISDRFLLIHDADNKRYACTIANDKTCVSMCQSVTDWLEDQEFKQASLQIDHQLNELLK
jgi:hypothetical protein